MTTRLQQLYAEGQMSLANRRSMTLLTILSKLVMVSVIVSVTVVAAMIVLLMS